MTFDLADIRAAQEHFGLGRPAPVEKDWYVIQALVAIAALDATPFRLIFAGGTALARAHRLGRRMSEDVDLKIVPTGPETMTGSQLRRRLGGFRASVTTALQKASFIFDPTNKSQHRSRNENRYTVYHLPFGQEVETGQGLRPAIQIELTYSGLRRPSVMLPVGSFVAEAFGRAPELPEVACVSVTETAAEKLVALTRRIAMELAGLSRDPDPTLVRHIYDLHFIRPHISPIEVAELARAVALADAVEHANQYPAYTADIASETVKALAAIEGDIFFRKQYASFVESMVYGDRPEFDVAFATVKTLATLFLENLA